MEVETKQVCSLQDCKKKLKNTNFICRCDKRFCNMHRLPEDHQCNFDYKQYAKNCVTLHKISKVNINHHNGGNAY